MVGLIGEGCTQAGWDIEIFKSLALILYRNNSYYQTSTPMAANEK